MPLSLLPMLYTIVIIYLRRYRFVSTVEAWLFNFVWFPDPVLDRIPPTVNDVSFSFIQRKRRRGNEAKTRGELKKMRRGDGNDNEKWTRFGNLSEIFF